MEFIGLYGPCAIVDHLNDGSRLQAFAYRKFRERWHGEAAAEMGRGGGGNSGSKRAHAAANAGALLVDGAQAAGRRVLRSGEVVELSDQLAKPVEDAVPPAGGARRRMVLNADEEPEATTVDAEGRGAANAAAFESYYLAQALAPSAGELERVMAAFRHPMPLCLRCSLSVKSHKALLIELGSLPGAELQPVPWAPAAWTLKIAGGDAEGGGGSSSGDGGGGEGGGGGVDEGDEATPDAVRRLMQLAAASGEAYMQEAAAMLPALALRPSYSDKVLDLCAAPGGKSVQLLDSMLCSYNPDDAVKPGMQTLTPLGLAGRRRRVDAPPEPGLLVVNDDGWQRQERTVRRCHYMPRSMQLLALVGEAQHFTLLDSSTGKPLLFDKVLCDVPCGGDGTIRKSPSKLTRWSVTAGLRIHTTQLAILKRGLSLLAPGGTLVYSTCALDPIQNEAVVAAALASEPESLRVVPPSEVLPPGTIAKLQFRKGLVTWKVASPQFESNGQLFDRWEDVPAELRATVEAEDGDGTAAAASSAKDAPLVLHPSMFNALSSSEAAEELSNCIRMLPTHGDAAGGFFVAVLQRRDETSAPPPRPTKSEGKAAAPSTPQSAAFNPCVAPISSAMVMELVRFFGITPEDSLNLYALVELSSTGGSGGGSGGKEEAGGGNDEEKDVNEGPSSSSSGAAAAAGGSPLLSLVAPRMSDLSSGSMQVVAAGQPIFARMPPGIAWWPKERPWRICQESASLFARGVKSQKRVLKMDIPGGYAEKEAVEYLLSRQTSMDGLIDCAERGELIGLDELIADGDGAVVLKLPAVLGAKALAIAGLFSEELGLLLLASDELLERYASLINVCCGPLKEWTAFAHSEKATRVMADIKAMEEGFAQAALDAEAAAAPVMTPEEEAAAAAKEEAALAAALARLSTAQTDAEAAAQRDFPIDVTEDFIEQRVKELAAKQKARAAPAAPAEDQEAAGQVV